MTRTTMATWMNASFATRPDLNASARFERQSRIPSYADGRWLANLSSPYYQSYTVKRTLALFANKSPYDGVFVDNASAFIANMIFSAPPNDGSYRNYFREFSSDETRQDLTADLLKVWGEYLARLKAGLDGKIVFANVGSNPVYDRISGPDVPIKSLPAVRLSEPIDGVLVEHAFSWTESMYDSAARLPRYRDAVKAYCSSGKLVAFQGEPRAVKDALNSSLKTVITLERAQLYGLARYYLTAGKCDLLDFQDDYFQPWMDWFPAITFDVGGSADDYFPLPSERAPGLAVTGPPAAADNVVGRRFGRALVLVKTRAHANSAVLTDVQSRVTVSLGADYRPLHADGTLGSMEREVVLSDFEGAILIPSSVVRPSERRP